MIGSHPVTLSRRVVRFTSRARGGNNVSGHSRLVSGYALLLARTLDIEDASFLHNLEMGALLHDIGKVGIPASILMKREPLTRLERDIIREHPVLGYEMIAAYHFLQEASRVVLYHHERCDGRGYPFGLSGNAIPLPARIFSVADALDAITSNRPYRRGRSFQEATQEIARCRGTQFDPDVVEAFLSVPVEDWISSCLIH